MESIVHRAMTRRRPWLLAAGALALLGIAVASHRPGLSPDDAEGTYAHDCCGTLALRDGEIVLGERKAVDFTVGHDEGGYYLLPDAYVGTWENGGFEIDGTRQVEKLRLDTFPKTHRVDLPSLRGSKSFYREPARQLRTQHN